jgi:hypothetical protein
MVATASKDVVLGLERQYWQALKDRDSETAMRLTDDTCIVVGPQGAMEMEKNALAGMIKEPPYEIKSFDLKAGDVKYKLVGEEVAIVAYPVQEEMVAGGKAKTLAAYDLSVWYRRDGQWVCAAHTESIADPSGGM